MRQAGKSRLVSRVFLRGLVLTFVIVAAGAIAFAQAIAPSGTGFQAKTMCSAVFIGGRTEESVRAEEFAGLHPLMGLIGSTVDRERKEVASSLFGLGFRRAVYREGLGCTLVFDGKPLLPPPAALTAPRAERPHDAIDDGVTAPTPPTLNEALDRAFAERDSANLRRTRAVLVVKNGRLIAERYAPGFDATMPMYGASMSKTVTGALVGILVSRGLIDLKAPARIARWQAPDDARRKITFGNLLQMSSGLRWSENAGDPFGDLVTLIFRSADAAAYAEDRKLVHPPGTHFAYDTGTSVIVSRILLTALGGDRAAYLALPRTALFDPAGMQSAVMEPDAAGTLVGSSHVHATARDWARFGELYRLDGKRPDGVRVLPQGWVAYSTAPGPATQGRYGAHIWLNREGPNGQPRRRPSLPDDTMLMNGQFGQLVAVIPSRGVTIVRLGDTRDWDFAADPDRLIADVLASIL